MVGGDESTYFQHSGPPAFARNDPPEKKMDGVTFSVDLEPIYEHAEKILTGGIEMDLKDANTAAGQTGAAEMFIDKVKADLVIAEGYIKAVLTELAQIQVVLAPIESVILGFVSMFKKDPKAVAAENISSASIDALTNISTAYLKGGDNAEEFAKNLDMGLVKNLVTTIQSHGSVIVPPK
jgi:hypothetical protein